MGEVINIQVGRCGNLIGKQFWETICAEHGVNKLGVCDQELTLRFIKTYFWEVRGLTFRPRSVLIDLEKSTMNAVRNSPYGQIFKPDNFVFGSLGDGNNWARCHFSEGAELCNAALNVVRREAEACNSLKAIEMIHSIGGGTGAGLGSLLLCKLREEYPKQVLSTFSVFPCKSCAVESYNAILALHHLIDNTNNTFCLDNDLNYKTNDPNEVIAHAISGITAPARFPGETSMSCKKFSVNAMPFPRLHFFIPGMTPLEKKECKFSQKNSTVEIISRLFDPQNFLVGCDMKGGKFLTATCVFRGKVQAKDAEQTLFNMKPRLSSRFVEWIPDSLKLAFTEIPPPGFSKMATVIANTTAIQDLFKRVGSQYLRIYKRKTFLHSFTDEGLDVLEFEAAHAALTELISDYSDVTLEAPSKDPANLCSSESSGGLDSKA